MTIPDGAKTINSWSVAVMLDRDSGGGGQELCAFETSADTVDAACETWNKLPPDHHNFNRQAPGGHVDQRKEPLV
jgi:hypothetical protein